MAESEPDDGLESKLSMNLDDGISKEPTDVSSEMVEVPGHTEQSSMNTSDADSAHSQITCSICIDNINLSSTISCNHDFCYACIILWSAEKQECPLCQKYFENIRAMNQIISLVTRRIGGKAQETSSGTNDSVAESGGHQELSSHVLRKKLAILSLKAAFCNSALLQHRQTLYRENLWSSLSPSKVTFTLPFLQMNSEFAHKLKMWVVRELSVIFPEQIQICFIADLIFILITKYEIRSNAFQNRLRPYLGPQTLHFINELYLFASTPHIRHDSGAESHQIEGPAFSLNVKVEQTDGNISIEPSTSTSCSSNAGLSNSAPQTLENLLNSMPALVEYFNDAVLNRRNYVYKYSLWSKLDMSILSYDHTVPSFFIKHPEYVARLIPWMTRELYVLLNDLKEVYQILHLVLSLLVTYEIMSEQFCGHLHPFLSQRTGHFIHELFHLSAIPDLVWDYEVIATYEYKESDASSCFESVPIQVFSNVPSEPSTTSCPPENSTSSSGNNSCASGMAIESFPSLEVPSNAAKYSMDTSLFVNNFVQSPENRPTNLQPPYCQNGSHGNPCSLGMPSCIFSIPKAPSHSQNITTNNPNDDEHCMSDISECVDLVSDSDSSSGTLSEGNESSTNEYGGSRRSKKQCLNRSEAACKLQRSKEKQKKKHNE